MRLVGITKKDVDADQNSKNVPKLESVEVRIKDNVNLTLIIGQTLRV